MKKLLIVIASTIIISACSQMLETSQNLRKSLNDIIPTSNKTTVNVSIPQICKDFEENEVKARKYYGQYITFKAKAVGITDSGYGNLALITFKSGKTEISYFIKDMQKAATIKKGKTYTGYGEIREIQLNYSSPCGIVVMGESLK